MKNATPPTSRTILTATRLLAILGIGTGVLAGATPTEAQNYAPTRFRVDAVRHVDRGDAEVDLRWLHPTSSNATSFTVHYKLHRGNHGSTTCATTPANPTTNLNTTTATETRERRITIRQLDRETSACFWIRADFGGGSTSIWLGVEDHPINLRDGTSIGTIPAPRRPGVTAGDARITVTFGGLIPGFCMTEEGGLTTRWLYTRRLEGEAFGDDPTDTVHVLSLAGLAGGSVPVVQNIANGNSYVFKIRLQCKGPMGPISPWSEESMVVTPRGTINAITEPQGLSVVPVRVEGRDTAALRLTWGHPSSGAPGRYRLQYRRSQLSGDDTEPGWTSVTIPGSSQEHDITALRFNTEYEIQLRAESEDARPDCNQIAVCGPWARTSGNTGVANRPPVAANDLEAIVLEVGRTRDIDVAHYFSDPDGDNLMFTAFSQNGQVATIDLVGAPSNFRITAVSAGSATVSISATDPGGLSARAGIEVTVQNEPLPVLPGDPTDVEAFLGPDGPAVLWEPPSPVEGAIVAAYRVSWRDDVNRVWSDPVHLGVDARTWAPMVAAVPGRTYEFRVRAVSDRGGAGPWSAPASVAVPELPTPSAPLNLVLESNAGDLIATWDEPSNVDDVPVISYTLRFRGTALNDRWHTETVSANVLQARIPSSYGFVRGGTYRAQVRASGAGGDGPWSAEAETTIPAEGPKPVITATIQPPANRAFTITVTFPEPVTNFTLNDLVIAGGDASDFTREGAVYTALITPTDSGTLTIDIPIGAALDANGYDSEAADTFSIEVDITPPTGVITTAQPGPFKDPFTIKIIFSEPIQNLSLDNISISRGQVENLQPTAGSETEYTALVTPVGTGTLTIVLPAQTFYDYNGHRNEEPVRFEVEVDTVRPTVEITSTSEPPIKGPFPLTFTFSEEVNGFERDDVEFPTGAGWLQTLHKTGPTTYTGTARPTTTGQIVVRVPENAATDTIGHGNEESEFELTAVIDDNPGAGQPIVEIWTTATSPVQIPFEIRIVFSEPVLGMTAEKLVVTNGSVGLLTDRQSARTDYSTILWPEENGTVTVNLPAGAVIDDFNNPNHAAPEFSIEAVLTPVPAVPTAGLMLLGAALAAAGWRKRRQAPRS